MTASRIVITDSNGNYTTTNAIFIDGSSNVGIGIQTPASRLHVVGLTHNDSGVYQNYKGRLPRVDMKLVPELLWVLELRL